MCVMEKVSGVLRGNVNFSCHEHILINDMTGEKKKGHYVLLPTHD